MNVQYVPKGGMCANCAKVLDDCRTLPFYKMAVLEKSKTNKTIIVKCYAFERKVK